MVLTAKLQPIRALSSVSGFWAEQRSSKHYTTEEGARHQRIFPTNVTIFLREEVADPLLGNRRNVSLA